MKHRYFVTNFEVNVAAMLGLLTHYATYSNSGSGSINVRKFTVSDTGLLKDELFALSEIHAKSPGVSHFALYNDSDHYDCVKNTTSLARALRNREGGSMPPSAITDQELFYYDIFVRSACERRATDTIIEVPTGAAGVGIALSAADIARLGPDKWLNDELVNSCAVLINNLSKDMRTGGTAALKFGIASSFFLTKYLNYGPNMSGGPLQGSQAAQVFRSFGKLSKKQLGSGSSTSGFDVLVVPVVDFHNPELLGTPALGRGGKPIPGQFHDGNPYHWRGVVVDFNKKSASGFDSFNDKTKSEDSAGDVLGARCRLPRPGSPGWATEGEDVVEVVEETSALPTETLDAYPDEVDAAAEAPAVGAMGGDHLQVPASPEGREPRVRHWRWFGLRSPRNSHTSG